MINVECAFRNSTFLNIVLETVIFSALCVRGTVFCFQVTLSHPSSSSYFPSSLRSFQLQVLTAFFPIAILIWHHLVTDMIKISFHGAASFLGYYARDRGGSGPSTNFPAKHVGWRHIWLCAEEDRERGCLRRNVQFKSKSVLLSHPCKIMPINSACICSL